MLSKKIKAIIQIFRRGSEVEGLSRCPLRSASGIFDGGDGRVHAAGGGAV
jgi:hypothetical protein